MRADSRLAVRRSRGPFRATHPSSPNGGRRAERRRASRPRLGAHAHLAGEAHAAGWYNDVDSSSFVGGGGEGFGAAGARRVRLRHKDLAVDLASPLVAYKLVSWALNQEVPVWLGAIILAFTLAAVYVCLFDVDTLDDVLV